MKVYTLNKGYKYQKNYTIFMNKKGGYVYLLCDLDKERTYKIGVTRGDIDKRIKKLQTGNAGEIHLVNYHKSEAPFFVEKHLHLVYNTTNIRNEWFLLSDEDAMNFKNNCLKIEDMYEALKDNPFFKK